jgi:endonuclease YncB( thermonuclease family)
MAHDFKKYPELTNNQMNLYYFDSPHQQIAEDFDAKVVKVTDGDTIRVSVNFRDFDFPIRISNLMAAELNEEGGLRSRNRLKELIEGATVEVIINKNNRVGKWGRLLAEIRHRGFDIGQQMIEEGFAVSLDEEQLGIKELILLDVI